MAPKTKRLIHQYSEESLKNALAAIRTGEKCIREASREFGVPRGTLQDRIHGRVSEAPRRMGPDPVLSKGEEAKLVEWVLNIAKCGFPRKKEELLDVVQRIVKSDNRANPFKADRPGQKWYMGFLKRNPIISRRTAEPVSKARASITKEMIKKWFVDLNAYLEENNALDILGDPDRILNGDESGFCLCPKTDKVLAPKGWRNLYEVTSGKEKDSITVLVVFTASGKLCPPMVVFPYIRPPKAVIKSIPNGWVLGKTESGWMKQETFTMYMKDINGLNQWIENAKIKKPVLLLVDGHKSHMSMELSEYCYTNGIILYALPPNTTHILQPADVGLFKPIKENWRKYVRQWQNQPENVNNVLTKTTFCPLLKNVLEDVSSSVLQNAFRKCGLFPFDMEAVDYTKCVQNLLEDHEEHMSPNKTETSLSNKDFESSRKVIRQIGETLMSYGINPEVVINEINSYEEEVNTELKHSNSDLVKSLPTNENLVTIPSTPLEIGSIVPLDEITTHDIVIDDMAVKQTDKNMVNEDISDIPIVVYSDELENYSPAYREFVTAKETKK